MRHSITLLSLFLVTSGNSNPIAPYCADTCHCIPEEENGNCPDLGKRKFIGQYADLLPDFKDGMRLTGDKPKLRCQPYSAVAERTGENLCPGPITDPDADDIYCAFQYECVTKKGKISYTLQEVYEGELDTDDTIVITHKGHCGVCSSAQDLAAFLDPSLSFKAITVCGLPFSMPNYLGFFFADDDAFASAAEEVTDCFVREFGFTMTCARLWGSNTVNSIMSCTTECLRWLEDCIPRFDIPWGTGSIPAPNIASVSCPDTCPSNVTSCFPDGSGGGCPIFDGCSPTESDCACFNSLIQTNGNGDGSCELNECLKCDDETSGDLFNFWSGRTRRNSGILTSVSIPDTPFYMGLKRPCSSIEDIEQIMKPAPSQSCAQRKSAKKGVTGQWVTDIVVPQQVKKSAKNSQTGR